MSNTKSEKEERRRVKAKTKAPAAPTKTASKVDRPSAAEAVAYLRYLARTIELGSRPDPVADRQRLEAIAACIESPAPQWRKAGKLTIAQQTIIDAVARTNLPRGKLTKCLDRDAAVLASQFGWRGANDVERVRGLIVEARKRFRGK